MKRKLIRGGLVVVVVFVAVLFIFGRNAPTPDRSNEHFRLVASSDGKLTLEPGNQPKMTVVYGGQAVVVRPGTQAWRAEQSKPTNAAPKEPSK